MKELIALNTYLNELGYDLGQVSFQDAVGVNIDIKEAITEAFKKLGVEPTK